MMQAKPTWRSMLFCPAIAGRQLEKAQQRGADALILDLEDAVPADLKQSARAGLGAQLSMLAGGPADLLVRINRDLGQAIEDIRVAVGAGVKALVLPKVMGPEHIRLLEEVVAEREIQIGLAPGSTLLVPVIETPDALFDARAIAGCSARIAGLALGSEDFSREIQSEAGVDALYVAKMMALYAARAAGVPPIGLIAGIGSTGDGEDYAQLLRRSKAAGFAAAMCVHPRQVPLINSAFSPSAAQIAQARRIVQAYEAGLAIGKGAVLLDDQMIDKPVADRARRILGLDAQPSTH